MPFANTRVRRNHNAFIWYETLRRRVRMVGWQYRETVQWRYNGRDSISNHQPHHCLLSRLFRRKSKKTSKVRVTCICTGNSPVTGEFPAQIRVNSPHKWPVTRKMFPFDDVIMIDPWRHHDTATLSALLALCEGNPLADSLSKMGSDVFVINPNKLLNKQSSFRWSETQCRPYDLPVMQIWHTVVAWITDEENARFSKLQSTNLNICL